jgi:CRP-like cAMP-binding protein
MAKLDVIKENYVFQRLNGEQWQKIASISEEKAYPAGQIIFREGDQAKVLYILEEGKVLLEMRVAPYPERTPAPTATIQVVTDGELFSWSALVNPRVLTSSGITASKCRVIMINGEQLVEMMGSDPVMGYEVMTRLAEIIASRLKHSREMLMSERGLSLLSQAYSY